MKSIVGFFLLGLLTAGLVVQNQPTQTIDITQPNINIGSITPKVFDHLEHTRPLITTVEFIEAIEINPIGSTVGDFRFDRDGNIYFTSTDPATTDPRAMGVSILRFDKQKKEQKEVPMDGILKEEEGKELAWQCYDVDDFGNVYVGISHWTSAVPRHIFVLNLEGRVISKFDLPNFLPYSIAVDDSENIWIAGERFSAENANTKGARGQGEIRVYDKEGNLIAIPVGGFKPEDIASGNFVEEGPKIKFILQGETGTIYNFNGIQLADVWSYPLQQQSTNTSKHLLGLIGSDNYAVWHGAYINQASQEPFMMLISLAGDRLTYENKLMIKSKRSFIPAGADKESNIYFLSGEQGKTLLRRAKIRLTKSHLNKKTEQIQFINYE